MVGRVEPSTQRLRLLYQYVGFEMGVRLSPLLIHDLDDNFSSTSSRATGAGSSARFASSDIRSLEWVPLAFLSVRVLLNVPFT